MWEIYRNGHLVMQRKWHRQFGPVVGYYYGLAPVVIVADTELLKQILLRDFHKFSDRPPIISGKFIGGLDDSLLFLKGQRWKQVRAILSPAFTAKKLREISPVMQTSIDDFIENMDKDFENSKECELAALFKAMTLDAIGKAGMGLDLNVQKDYKNSKVLRAISTILSIEVDIFFVAFASLPALAKLLRHAVCQLWYLWLNSFESPIGALQRQSREVVKFRRLNPEKSKRSDLLQLMMDAQVSVESSTDLTSLIAGDGAEAAENRRSGSMAKNRNLPSECPITGKPEGLTDNEVIDNAFLMLLAGFETTSTTLAFLAKMLLRFPEVQERVREELVEATDGGTAFDFERLQRCQYTEAFIQETMRMYTPFFFFTARVANEEVKYGSMTIPKGMNVFSSIEELHYDEAVFPEPNKFRPERFLPENKTPAMAKSWQPFGDGPRNCIGMRFAQMEMKLALAKLLVKYRIYCPDEPKHDARIEVCVLPVLQHPLKHPLKCRLERLS
ncbi:cytochrome P450 3A12 [Galendromus occidentalis]|uniref:Cytochrome P450 3A12 n=1 Tax=Galendromus occidentalis TaxID=34638 RepID=A0AAJ6QUN4_9ACAR|nr:cytochrome P450 3A12 [Galendromus occidentalis]